MANGVRILVAPVSQSRSVTINVASRIGSGFESGSEQGISHFVEHMLFKGTLNRPSHTEIATAIERLGGTVNAVTEPEMTVIWSRVGRQHFREAVEVLSDMVSHPRFDREEIEKERRVILDELGMINDVPEEVVRRSVRARLWSGHGVGREVAGPPENVIKFTPQQLRAHAHRMFAGSNLVVSVAGDLDPNDAREVIVESFESIQDGRLAEWPSFAPTRTPEQRVYIDNRKADQAYFSVAGRALRRDDRDRYALDLACAAIGEGMGSRLFVELREKRGIVYEVFSSLFVMRDSGALLIEGSTDPETLNEALVATLAELSNVREHGIGPDELTRAREFIKGDILLSMEETSAVAAWYAREELLENDQLTPEAVVANFDAVGGGDVRRVVRRILFNDWAIVAASGPISEAAILPLNLTDGVQSSV